jgi:hypothetical protein
LERRPYRGIRACLSMELGVLRRFSECLISHYLERLPSILRHPRGELTGGEKEMLSG